ncbi:MAG TPA: DinB family protein [Gemmatimonadales bacterium]|nr:DinB family protein [Gemmatimonadales bacterium]
MSIAQTILPEFEHEMGTTRRVLAVVPNTEPEWRPHPKSTTIGNLAAHIATIPLWGRMTMDRAELDLGVPENAAAARVTFTSIPDLMDRFDRNVREARDAIASTSDSAMRETWTLKNGGTTVLSMPRVAVLRGFVLSHMIHHRGQLSVYLRLRDVPLPSIYGPTADTPR